MTQGPASNLDTVEVFFAALETNQASLLDAILDDEVVVIAGPSFDGSQEPAAEFEGRAAATAYLKSIPMNFSQVAFTDRQSYVTADGAVIFVESKGDLIIGASGAAYKNVYIFKFIFKAGRIVSYTENGNPIVFSKAFGLPLGVKPPIPTR